MWKLAVGAIGIVFGDIGTSPLYAFRETFSAAHHPEHPLPLDELHILGVISLMFWSMMGVVTLKYVRIIMRADNKGEGGSLALLALINRSSGQKRWTAGIVLLGVFATAQFLGAFVGGLIGGRFLAAGRPADVFFVCALLAAIWLAMSSLFHRRRS